MPDHPPSTPRRVLWIAEGQLGDLLLMTPAVRAIHESFPESEQTLLIVQRRNYDRPTDQADAGDILSVPGGGTSAVFAHNPHVARVMDLDRARLRLLPPLSRLRAEAGVVAWMRREKFDTAIAAFPQDRFFEWTFASGARQRIGESGRPLSFLLTRRLDATKESGGVLAYYCRLAGLTGAQVHSERTECRVPDAIYAWADQVLRRAGIPPGTEFLAVHPGSSGRYHIWPPERFASVIDEMNLMGVRTLLCGSEWDREVVEAVKARCRSDVPVVVIGQGVLHLAALLGRAGVCLSNDSGPRHVALAVGTRSVAVMAKFTDRAWGVYRDPAQSVTVISPRPCMVCGDDRCADTIPDGESFGSYCLRDVSVADVLEAVVKSLTPESPA
jgi:ADP-heptose:LPS heptosyltransferase